MAAARAVGVRRAGVASQEREQDLGVHVAKQAERAGPEPIQLRAELVGERDPRADQILPRSDQRPHRLGRVRVGLQHPEAVMSVRASSHSTNRSN